MKQKTITLNAPLMRGETEIREITLTKPNVLALKGLNMLSLMQLDVNTALILLPRISQPSLTKSELEKMEVEDFTNLTVEMTAFFTPQTEAQESSPVA